MAQPYVGEIRMFGGNFAPAGWMFCAGQLLPISEYETLFQLIGTTYGGDGESTFALPDLQGRIPVHMGTSTAGGRTYQIGETGGTETVTLNTQQIPQHNHVMAVANATATLPNPGGNQLGLSTKALCFIADNPNVQMAAGSVGPAGGSQPHDNMMPFLCISFIISLFGIFPSPT